MLPDALPRRSKYPLFKDSSPVNHTLHGFLDQKPQILGTWTLIGQQFQDGSHAIATVGQSSEKTCSPKENEVAAKCRVLCSDLGIYAERTRFIQLSSARRGG